MLNWRSLGFCLAATLLLIACEVQQGIPSLERRAHKLNAVIMCPVCPGESIDQSQNDLAVQMRGIVKTKLEQGWTEDQIKDFFVDGYGPTVLLEPPSSGFSLVLWIVPPIVLFVAGVMLVIILPLMSRSSNKRTDSMFRDVAVSNSELRDQLARIGTALGYDSDVMINSEPEVPDVKNEEQD